MVVAQDQTLKGKSIETNNSQQSQQINQSIQKKWKIILILVTAVAIFFSKFLYYFQTDQIYREMRRGCIWDLLVQGGAVAAIFTIFDHASHWFIDDWVFNNFIDSKKYPDLQFRKNRSYSISKWLSSALYYAPISVWSYIILKQSNFMPTWMGGNGNCRNLYLYFDNFDSGAEQMNLFYLIQFGKHLSRLFSHLFIKQQGVFYETALHHGLSTFLILYSYLSNMWIIGIMVLFTHDLSDLFLGLSRSYKDYRSKDNIISNILPVLAFSTWIGGRIIISLYCSIGSAIQGVIHMHIQGIFKQIYLDALYWPLIFMAVMLCCLQILQFFWTYFIIKGFIKQQKKIKQN